MGNFLKGTLASSLAVLMGFAFSASMAAATPITFTFSGNDMDSASTINGSLTFDDSLLTGPSPVLVSQSGFTGFNFVTTAPQAATWSLTEINEPSKVRINTSVTPNQFVTGVNFAAFDVSTSSFLTFQGNTFTTSFGFGPSAVTGSYTGSWTTTGGSGGGTITNPEPASLVLLGSGLIGLAFWRHKRSKV